MMHKWQPFTLGELHDIAESDAHAEIIRRFAATLAEMQLAAHNAEARVMAKLCQPPSPQPRPPRPWLKPRVR